MSKTTEKKQTVAQAAKASQNRKIAIIGVIAAVVIVAGLFAVLSGGSKKPTDAGTAAGEVHAVTVTGDVLDPMPDTSGGAADPGLGKKPPELSGRSFDGSTISIVPGGKPKLVIFVAHWCPHCRAEVPRIVQWMNTDQKPKNLDLLAVSTAVNRSPTNYPPSKWFQTEKFTVPVLTDDAKSTAAQAWGLPGYPYLVMVRADGTVAARTSGEFADVTALNDWVQKAYTA